ncbi:MAG: DNA polymerase III subunit gamma/tau, partial [Chloroflexi bacterium]|nr:DNA polymerase III subunit gamma/tau [Chloroflexota bacterium]
ARILYRAANCDHLADGDPCNVCPTCLSGLDGSSLDLVEIDAASNRGIDDVRDLRDKVAYRPSAGRYRLYILDEAHEFTTAAWDAFLKTLEEPPPHAIFVLATTEAHKVPATIVSRCQRFDFRRIRFDAAREQLKQIAGAEGLAVDEAVLERIARAARGGLRDALSLLDQLTAFSRTHIDMDMARAVLGLPAVETVRLVVEGLGRHDPAAVMAQVADVAEGGADLRQFVDELTTALRGLLLVRAGAEARLVVDFPAEDVAWLHAQAPSWTVAGLSELVQILADAQARIRDAQQFQVQVELALLSAAHAGVGDLRVPVPPVSPLVPAAGGPPTASPATGSMPPGSAAAAHAQPSPTEVGELASAQTGAPQPATDARSTGMGGAGPAPGTGIGASAAPAATPAGRAAAAGAAAGRAEATASRAEPQASSEPEPTGMADGAPVAPSEADQLDSEEALRLVRQRWDRVKEHAKSLRPGLATSLSSSEPIALADTTLVVAFATDFNRKRAERADNRRAIQEGVRQELGRELQIMCTLPEASRGSESGLVDDPVINYAARTFGGRPQRLSSPAMGDPAAP